MTAIENFLSSKNFAVVGVSRNKRKFGNVIYSELKKRGMNAIPINPNVDSIDNEKCYKNLSEYKGNIDSVITVVPPKVTRDILNDCKTLRIKKIWLQQGSESKEVIQFCDANDFTYVSNKCLLMYLEPVKSFHSIHRFFVKLLKKY